ncbi:hypothetical protein BDV93DRAFT_551865 [Ceratobasidium sp. AG-I]|nr:hypothetical protein BDV93DRAFT_551865 [Ceratobasidium sp. AG-I]
MPRQSSGFFSTFNNAPDPNAHPSLWEHRLRQRRPISQNPFVQDEPQDIDYGLGGIESPGDSQRDPVKFDEPSDTSKDGDQSENKNMDVEWGDHAPEWLNLFYDLAWTATFASLTSNNKFKAPWDSISYIVFFIIAWWMWVSQVFYSVDFYTDDWFHLLIVFIQLLIFGALAATTRGFDVSNYILHSPGSFTWESTDLETTTPERYNIERVTKISLEAITVVVAISRLLLLIQYLRGTFFTARSRRYPLRLLIVPAALAISTTLFFIAYRITKKHGEESHGATVKFIFWGVAILVEVIAHVLRFQWEINDGIRLRSHGSIVGRLGGITTIILGEGINAIAGTFYAIMKAPGFGSPTGTAIICCALVIFFLAYLYFEGTAPLKSVRRRAAWALMHLPWLLAVILLLEGVKNQLLLSSFINTISYLMERSTDLLLSDDDPAVFNATFKPILLQGGQQLDDQFQKLTDLVTQNISSYDPADLNDDLMQVLETELTMVWFLRLLMSTTVYSYINFMDNDTISDETQQIISKYQTNYTFTYQDYDSAVTTGSFDIYFGVLADLMKSTMNNARYIMALCGLTFICLGTMNLIQSWPRDRFQWASVISRYTMGFIMMLLLVLNVGKYQTYFVPDGIPDSKRAGFINWIDANWVLPTLALAYGIQFIVDTALVYVAVYFTRKSLPAVEQMDKSK